ncbi:ATP-binding protein [Brevibacillus porteri]|uniref:HAMP domain-containing sensor histidine kinase n=1 Tax=Brevibacillus porteri TaxID=2126350 RepID=UPI00370B056F
MKIKYWLLSTYLLVMLMPVAAIYILYLLVSEYDQRQDLREYFEISERIADIEKVLEDPSLYQTQSVKHYTRLQSIANDTIQIELFRYDGIRFFNSADSTMPFGYQPVHADMLFQNLYQLRKNSRTYSLKKPVFKDGRIIGIFQITLAREEWISSVKTRTFWLVVPLVAFFLLLYLAVVWLLNRKLNQPLVRLMGRMSAFAENRDVTEWKYHSRDEIGELIHHFENMRKQIEKAQQAVLAEQREKEYLVAALAHDVKTPLTSIRAYAEALFLSNHLSDRERREYRTVLFEKIAYMKDMLDDLTMYTALRSSVRETDMAEVDGEEIFEMLFAGYDELCQEKGVLLQTEISVSAALRVNASHMMRLVDNLMNNALRYTNRGRSIGLSAVSSDAPLPSWIFAPFRQEIEELNQDHVLLIVQNEGEAIPDELCERIFEPFFQTDLARSKEGTSSFGLGLSIAAMIMNNHGGNIRVWSSSPYGTTFVCCLKPERKG